MFRSIRSVAQENYFSKPSNCTEDKTYAAYCHLVCPEYNTDKAGLMAAIQALDKTLPSRIDYIFTGPRSAMDSGQITVRTSRVVMKQIIDGVHASDHYGIYTELRIKNP